MMTIQDKRFGAKRRSGSVGGRAQRGSSLIVIMALVMGLMVLAAMSVGGNVATERASANARDGDLAFQAAEQALRAGEKAAGVLSGPSDGNTICFGPNGVAGVCYLAGNNYRLSVSGYTGLSVAQAAHCPSAIGCAAGKASIMDADPAVAVPTGNTALSRQPSYIIEVLPSVVAGEEAQNIVWMFRVTAKGWGVSPSSQKILQSVYYRPTP